MLRWIQVIILTARLLLCLGYIEINTLKYLFQTPEEDQISLVHAIYELGWFVQTLM